MEGGREEEGGCARARVKGEREREREREGRRKVDSLEKAAITGVFCAGSLDARAGFLSNSDCELKRK